MLTADFVIGIDGGGTKTAGALLRSSSNTNDGSELSCGDAASKIESLVAARAVTGSTNWNSVGDSVARANLFAAISALLSQVEQHTATTAVGVCVTHVVLGMACVDTQADKDKLCVWLREYFVARRRNARSSSVGGNGGGGVGGESGSTLLRTANDNDGDGLPYFSVHGDAVTALASGTGGELSGVTLISGTGVIVYGRNAETKHEVRVAGFGPLLGDLGSGYAIGCDVLTSIMRRYDGRDQPPTDHNSDGRFHLQEMVLQFVQASSPEDLIGWAYSASDVVGAGDGEAVALEEQGTRGGQEEPASTSAAAAAAAPPSTPWSRIASLAPLCFEALRRHRDPAAANIIERTCDSLCEYVVTAVRRLYPATSHNNNNSGDGDGETASSSQSSSSSVAAAAAASSLVRLPVVLSGGIASQPEIRAGIECRLKQLGNKRFVLPRGVTAEIVLPSVSPEVAAALLALHGVDLSTVKLL